MTSREKFEQAIKSRFGDLIDYRVCKNSDGEYMAWDMQVAWWAWQAAETDLAVQLANAESKCRELASENAALKSFGDKLYSMYKGLETSGGGFHDEQSIPYQQAALDAAISAFEEIKTPATDAFLAEVRAQGVEMFASKCKEESKCAHSSDYRDSWFVSAENADDFAAQLRQEAAQ